MIKTVLWTLAGSVILVAVGLTVWIFADVSRAGLTHADTTFVVVKGEGVRTVANHLESQHLIQHKLSWVLFAALTGRSNSILPGQYTILSGHSGKAVLEQLVAGPTEDREVTVTIKEGKTLDDVATLLEQKKVVSAAAFLGIVRKPGTFISTWSTDLFASKPPSVDLEGYVFPDTYRLFKDSPAESVVTRMVKNMDERLDPAFRNEIAASGHSLHDILTMASILEKEGNNTADWGMIADIFWRRINEGMPLQSDATVNYATGKSNVATTTINDTKFESPYNTYLNKGLPPGPIDNPGLRTMQAALHPTPNEYVYFLTYNGKAVFAKTYDEHLANKRKYLSGS